MFMIMGSCPYEKCDGPLWIGDLPYGWVKTECEECKKWIWTLTSCFDPISYTDEEFRKRYIINEETKQIEEQEWFKKLRKDIEPLAKEQAKKLSKALEDQILYGNGFL